MRSVMRDEAAEQTATLVRQLVSPRLRAEFGNGDQFYAKAARSSHCPEGRADRPNKDFLE
jgi:putative restriction endonuclease